MKDEVEALRGQSHWLSCERERLMAEVEALRAEAERAWGSYQDLGARSHEELSRLEADLAAARAALEKVDAWLLTRPAGIHWASNGLHDDLVVTLSRLGTGEALEAVREAQQTLEEAWYVAGAMGLGGDSHDRAVRAMARLRAVFGEKP